MIYLEDQFALNEKLDCIIPFTCTEYDGRLLLEVYEPVKKTAEKFIEIYSRNPFSEDALRYVDAHLLPMLEKWGYERSSGNLFDWGYAYVADNKSQICKNKILKNTLRISADHNYENLTGIITESYQDESGINCDAVFFGTVVNNKILSVAAENTAYMSDRMTEIAVETAGDFRRNGYGVSNTAALALYLTEKGKQVWYKCSRYNTASQKTAAAAGLRYAGKNYYYAAYKKED